MLSIHHWFYLFLSGGDAVEDFHRFRLGVVVGEVENQVPICLIQFARHGLVDAVITRFVALQFEILVHSADDFKEIMGKLEAEMPFMVQ